MEKEMFAVVAIYKSEAVDYLNKKGIARGDALIINTVEDFEEAKNKLIKDVHFISAPMGIASNEDDLKKLLVTIKKEDVENLLGSVNIQEVTGKTEDKNEEAVDSLTEEEIIDSLTEEAIVDASKNFPKREVVEPEVEVFKMPEIKNPPKTPLKNELKSEKPAAKKPVTRKKKVTKK